MGFEYFPPIQNSEGAKERPSAKTNMFLAEAERNNPRIETLRQELADLNQLIGRLNSKLRVGLPADQARIVTSERAELQSRYEIVNSLINNHRDNKDRFTVRSSASNHRDDKRIIR